MADSFAIILEVFVGYIKKSKKKVDQIVTQLTQIYWSKLGISRLRLKDHIFAVKNATILGQDRRIAHDWFRVFIRRVGECTYSQTQLPCSQVI